ncbi:hypothetical protein U1Q18_004729 [Sarracenia purpurea var. burkii]
MKGVVSLLSSFDVVHPILATLSSEREKTGVRRRRGGTQRDDEQQLGVLAPEPSPHTIASRRTPSPLSQPPALVVRRTARPSPPRAAAGCSTLPSNRSLPSRCVLTRGYSPGV